MKKNKTDTKIRTLQDEVLHQLLSLTQVFHPPTEIKNRREEIKKTAIQKMKELCWTKKQLKAIEKYRQEGDIRFFDFQSDSNIWETFFDPKW